MSDEVPQPSPRQVARFWARVRREDSNACWPWPGCTNDKGYGHVRVGGKGGRAIGTHQLAFYLTHGYLPPMVLHKCDVRNCCNPAHLFAGDGKVNADDKQAKGRGNQPKGERNAFAKLTADQVVAIRQRRAAGETCTALAREFGVFHTTILSVANRKTWRHI